MKIFFRIITLLASVITVSTTFTIIPSTPYYLASIGQDVKIRVRLPLDTPDSKDDYLVFKPAGEQLDANNMFTLKHNQVLKITNNDLFNNIVSRGSNWGILIRPDETTKWQPLKVDLQSFRAATPFRFAYYYKDATKDGSVPNAGYLEENIQNGKFKEIPLDLSNITWIQKNKAPRVLSLDEIITELNTKAG